MKKFENVYQDAALMKKALLGEALKNIKIIHQRKPMNLSFRKSDKRNRR